MNGSLGGQGFTALSPLESGYGTGWRRGKIMDETVTAEAEAAPVNETVVLLSTQLAEAQQALEASRREAAEAQRTYRQFREQLVETAARLAHEHDWCTEVETALYELGLRREMESMTRTVHVRVAPMEVDVTVTGFRGEPSDDWVIHAIGEQITYGNIEWSVMDGEDY